MFKFKFAGIFSCVVIALVLFGCASTKMKASWKDPQAGPIQVNKVIAFFFSDDAKMRRAAENELVRQMKRTQGVAAHTLIPEVEYEDLGKVREAIQSQGFDGAVIMRLIGAEENRMWVPGRYVGSYYTFNGYYNYAWSSAYTPGYLKTDQYVYVETNLYSLTEDKLIWSGLSETINPRSAANLVDDVARAVVKDLKAKGLVE
jgi:hypothetical protein